MKTAALPAPPDADPNVSERTFQVLHEVAVASSGVLDPSAVAQIASDGARELLGVDSAGLGICDPQTGQLRPLGENDPELAERPVDQALDTGVSSTAFRLREPVLIHDYRRWESARPEAVARGIRSVASVPLIARDRAVGALTVRSFKPRFWTTEDVRLLGLLAAEVAPALEAARLHVESERRRAEAEALAELVRVGATERDPDRVIALICEQAGRLIGADYAAVAMITPDGGRIWRGMWGNRSQHWRRRPSGRGTGPLGRTVRERRTIVMENVSDDPAIAPHTHVAEGGKTLLSTPLIFREELLGALTLGWRTPVKPSADQVSLAEALAGYAATVLDNARAYAEQQTARQHAESVADTLSQRERALQALHDVAVAAGGVLDPEALGRLVVESTRALLDFDSAGLYWWNNARGALRPLAESDPNRRTPETVLQPGIGIAGEVYRDGQTLVVEDYLAWPGRLRKISTRIKSVAALPLRLEERTLGVLVVRSHTRRALQPDEINLLELLAAQVAPALEAARLHAESQRRRTEAEALAELARQGAVAHEIKPVVDMVCRRACELIDADFAALLAHGDDGAGWLGVAGNRSDIWHKRRRISGRGPAGKSMAEERTVVFRRGALEADGSLDGLAMMAAEEAETALAVPLIRRTGPFGSLVIGWREALNVNAEQRRLAEALGGYAAAVLDNALAHAETERRRTEAEELAELVRQGAVEHDAERVINLICEHATNLTGADYAGIRLIDDEGLTWRGMAGNRTDAWRTPRPSRGAGSTSQAMAAGKTIVSHIKDLQAGSVKLDSDSVRAKEGGVLEMATPFVYRGTARGALIVGWRSEIEPSPDQIRVAEALAGFATVILENARAHLALAQQALYDELTELPNRRLFQDRLEQAILVAQREARPIGLLLMDLDRFKEVNDTLGHQAGDVLLRAVARRLRAALRTSDTVARLGGDEFAAVLTSMEDAAGALVAANKLLDATAEPTLLGGKPIQVAGSIGIALCPEHGEDPETLLRHADVAMYVAKRNGGGSAIYGPDMDRDHADRLVLGHDLRRAVEEGELMLEFQPRFNLATRNVDGVEALVRWNHPEQGVILPAHFIPMAEQTGLIRQLSRWVLARAFEQRRAWHNAGLDLNVAVNLSMRDLHDPTLPDAISKLAQAYREQPNWLIVEITEGAVMSDPGTAQRAMAKLRTLGIRISIDDFGTGYSSLAYLNQLAVDEIKVDRSFVYGMADDPKQLAIVKATVEMGHALGAAVVAEGVEEQSALDALGKMGCDGAQGFHICTPIAPGKLVEWLREFRDADAS